MKRVFRILLVILAVLVVAAGGFWGGTQFAYRQVAANPVQQAAISAPAANAGPGSNAAPNFGKQDSNRPDSNQQQRGPGKEGSEASNRDSSSNGRDSSQNHPNMNNGGVRMMMSGPARGGGMMDRQSNGFSGMPGMSLGRSFLGGGLMLFGLLFPLGFAILMVLGIIILFRMVRHPVPATVVNTTVCAKCGATIQTGWTHCPHCGELI
jgi:hypothetical protein